jgi:tetratricopeptide (TPR) repeat protein
MRTWVPLLLVAIVSSGARAEDADTAAARQHFTDGSRAFALGDFQLAIKEYKAGYKARPNPEFLFNIAQAYRLAGDPAQALFFYKSYLSNAPDSEQRAEVEARIKACEADLAARQKAAPPMLIVTPPPPTTPVVVERRQPVYKKWWLWTIVGGVAAGGGLALGLTLGLPRSLHTTLPTIGPNASVLVVRAPW